MINVARLLARINVLEQKVNSLMESKEREVSEPMAFISVEPIDVKPVVETIEPTPRLKHAPTKSRKQI